MTGHLNHTVGDEVHLYVVPATNLFLLFSVVFGSAPFIICRAENSEQSQVTSLTVEEARVAVPPWGQEHADNDMGTVVIRVAVAVDSSSTPSQSIVQRVRPDAYQREGRYKGHDYVVVYVSVQQYKREDKHQGHNYIVIYERLLRLLSRGSTFGDIDIVTIPEHIPPDSPSFIVVSIQALLNIQHSGATLVHRPRCAL